MASVPELSDRELRLARMRSQRLLPGSGVTSVAAAAKAALTIQAQDVPAATLAVRARTSGLNAEQARREAAGKTACRSWLMRNTIFLFASADLAWMRPLLAPRPLAHAEKRLEALGGQPAAGLVLEALPKRLAQGPLHRDELREMLAARGAEANEVFYWTVHAAALRGLLVVRPALEARAGFVAAEPGDEIGDREAALGKLASRYLDAYGPATADDFAYFFKMPKSDARLGWKGAGRTVEVETERGAMTALPAALKALPAGEPLVRLLGAYDHFLLGWRGRSLTVPERHQRKVHPGAGYIKATAFLDGLAFGTWKLERSGDSLVVAVHPFGRLPRGAMPGLEREAAEIGRFFEAEAELQIVKS
ncbi:MAG: winged helix DNA-binding domain-containing protein [Actinomycetota bacterium]|nr:winged helix DNA-binding domain-containing protein [Actinomycetota bacterium]